ncbi:hypothetical protein F5J12DRAFT_574024 [Pisolithus orientalis]|uniref:uncharacterized protein n=1 Tax=Pisolithus orientalis TaxID=936130 RepID=UPI0022241E35|nr:uncharacterized protein F5J12DRAFT_574024 [Pisolithus orientalis]KAI6010969.1 hypothetical protein F5J12DRAFT_574024 [Pisolithus orientalis]
MPFPFTFRLSVPGLNNPFLAAQSNPESGSHQRPVDDRQFGNSTAPSALISARRIPIPPHRHRTLAATHSYSLSPPVPLARKRGWVPSSPEPSQATTNNTSTSGYLDTPAKYRNHMPKREPERETEEMIADLPPAKRRRTLAGSIVSTALSAALIGTAVGLTVYRLIFDSWRDRGKDTNRTITDVTDDQPPPPYHPGNWTAAPAQIEITPPTPQTKRVAKARHHVPTPARRTPVVRQRRVRVGVRAAGTPPPARGASPHHTLSSPPHLHSGFDLAPSQRTEEARVDSDAELDEMDWIGGRLSQLIEEGQKALNREIVVMSDAKEDEMDDGEGNWEEEPESFVPSISRRGSIRSLRSTASPKKRRHDANEAHLPLASSHHSSYWQPATPTAPRHAHTRGLSAEAERGSNHTPIAASFKEDESSWQSPELRESMARARAQYMQNLRGA